MPPGTASPPQTRHPLRKVDCQEGIGRTGEDERRRTCAQETFTCLRPERSDLINHTEGSGSSRSASRPDG